MASSILTYRIESDGTRRGTHVFNADTGEEIHGVHSITWKASVNAPPMVEIVLIGLGQAKIYGEYTVETLSRDGNAT